MAQSKLPAKLYLLEEDQEEDFTQIRGDKLPSYKQVLGFFVDQHKNHNLTIREAARKTLDEIALFYINSTIPMRLERNVLTKIEHLYEEYRLLMKSCHRGNKSHINNEKKFKDKFEDLFDISHVDALHNITRNDVKEFLKEQKKPGRPGTMMGIHRKRREGRVEMLGYQAETVGTESNVSTTQSSSSTSPTSTSGEGKKKDDPDFVFRLKKLPEPSSSRTARHLALAKRDFINESIVSVLDSCKISDPCAIRLIIPVVEALNIDPRNLVISRSTLMRRRHATRQDIVERIKDSFKVSRGAVVHFDGKLMKNITGKRKVDRMPVKVTSGSTDKLLGVPKTEGNARSIAACVQQQLQEWNISEEIEACCFDTTNVNTGCRGGAGVLLEDLLERSLLFVLCRHHIYELVLKVVYEDKVGISSGPKVLLFVRFEEAWSKINLEQYKPGIEDLTVKEKLHEVIESTIHFINQQMLKPICRADYREFLELYLLFLGGKLQKKEKQVIFHPPGPNHHARWMAKALYSLKIFLFQDQFHLTKRELNGLLAVNIFIIKHYLKLWFKCPVSSMAPYQDFNFLQTMVKMSNSTDEAGEADLAKKIVAKFHRHLWYLSEEAMGLAFYDENVPISVKKEMAQRLLDSEESEDEEEYYDYDDDDDEELDRTHRFIVPLKIIFETFSSKKFSEFISKKTFNFFKRFELSLDFLKDDPSIWSNIQSYREGIAKVATIKVVNDTAERSVQLMSEYNDRQLTKDEKELQFILQVVSEYRAQNRSYTKKDLMTPNPNPPQ